MKRILFWFTNHQGLILLLVASCCFYAVFQIKLGWFWSIGSINNADGVNSIIENLSYSFIAAYIFYLLTIVLSRFSRKLKLTPIIRTSVKKIGEKEIRSVLGQFAQGKNMKVDYHDTEQTAEILSSKNWDSEIPIYKQYEGISLSYFRYLNFSSRQIKDRVSLVISRYKDDITDDQLVALEEFTDLLFFNLVESLGNHNNITVNDGRESIINEFIKMQRQYLELEKKFGIS